jgi:hypothetical protein
MQSKQQIKLGLIAVIVKEHSVFVVQFFVGRKKL